MTQAASAVHAYCIRAARAWAFALLHVCQPCATAAAICVAITSPADAVAANRAPPSQHPLAGHVAEASLRFGIKENWIWAVMRQESGGNPRARSPVGAQGLMQIMPATWAMLTARYRLGSDPWEVRANIHAGAAYLRMMWDRYRDVQLMLAAYNAGPGRTDAYAAGRRGLPSETMNYVARIAPSLGHSGIAPRVAAPSLAVQPWRSANVFIGRDAGISAVADEPHRAQRARDQDAPADPVYPAHIASRSTLFFAVSGSEQ